MKDGPTVIGASIASHTEESLPRRQQSCIGMYSIAVETAKTVKNALPHRRIGIGGKSYLKHATHVIRPPSNVVANNLPGAVRTTELTGTDPSGVPVNLWRITSVNSVPPSAVKL